VFKEGHDVSEVDALVEEFRVTDPEVVDFEAVFRIAQRGFSRWEEVFHLVVDVHVGSEGGGPGGGDIVAARGPGAGAVLVDKFGEDGGGFVAVCKGSDGLDVGILVGVFAAQFGGEKEGSQGVETSFGEDKTGDGRTPLRQGGEDEQDGSRDGENDVFRREGHVMIKIAGSDDVVRWSTNNSREGAERIRPSQAVLSLLSYSQLNGSDVSHTHAE